MCVDVDVANETGAHKTHGTPATDALSLHDGMVRTASARSQSKLP